ncbi:MAG: hypothetical protein M1820_006171 [Bogoriella megaspora]|nr:MAG: hypothetical protein M1820_006171 [Bogoriella megaspora]
MPPLEERGKAPEEMKAYMKFDPTYHPDLSEDDFCHVLYGKPIKDYGKAGKDDIAPKRLVDDPDYKVLCRNCGWNESHVKFSGYTSRVKVFHTKMNSALWNVGADWMLRDEPNDCTLANDCEALEFLHLQNTTIPIPKIHRLSSQTDKFQLTLMKRAPGDTLYNVWHTYTKEERRSIARQLGGYIRQWRQLTAPRAQKVTGERLHDILIGWCSGRLPSCKRIGYTTEEWLEELSPELRKGLAMENEMLAQEPEKLDQALQELKDNFPRGEPYVFTHGDLNLSNIIVSEGKITGIIDWERAGFYPWWAERMFAHMVPDDRFDEIFEVIEDDICPGYDTVTFVDRISRHVGRVMEVWGLCPRFHRGEENAWIRRPFCECKPYSGRIQQCEMGVVRTHEIGDRNPRFTLEDYKEYSAWCAPGEDVEENPQKSEGDEQK